MAQSVFDLPEVVEAQKASQRSEQAAYDTFIAPLSGTKASRAQWALANAAYVSAREPRYQAWLRTVDRLAAWYGWTSPRSPYYEPAS